MGLSYTVLHIIILFSIIISLVTFQPSAENLQDEPYSIVFIIDNSSSNTTGNDESGERFKATVDLIDYIYQNAPETKVGLVIFASRMWFYGPDNRDLSVSVPRDQFHNGDGCYIPPLGLNEVDSGYAL